MAFVLMGSPDSHAREIARSGYIRVRAEMNRIVYETPHEIEYKPEPIGRGEVEQLISRLERAANSDAAFNWEVTSLEDTSGDPQIGFDLTAAHEMFGTAIGFGYLPLGEEDEFRLANDAAPTMRGEAIRNALYTRKPLAIMDPIDGTHQCAAMGQLSGFAHAVMCVLPNHKIQAAICLGDGRLVSTDGDSVWYSDLTVWPDHGDEAPAQLNASRIRALRHYKTTWVIPAYKPWRLSAANDIVMHAGADKVQMLAPLAGNPGILSSVLLSGAVAGYQPKSWAWDQIVLYMGAVLGFTVLQASTGRAVGATDLANSFLRNLSHGDKTPGHVIGKSREDAERLRAAVVETLGTTHDE